MTNQTTWTDNAGAINNANAVTPLPVGGGVPSGTTDSGTGVKISGLAASALNSTTPGQRSDILTSGGAVMVMQTSTAYTVAPADGSAGAVGFLGQGNAFGAPITSGVTVMNWNGTQLVAQRGNFDTAALLTYAAAAAGTNGADQTNHNGRGVKLVIDITAITGVGATLTVTVQGKDAASGKYYTILASTALAAAATTTPG